VQMNCGHPNAGAMPSLSMKIGSAVVGKQRDGHVESADVQIRGINVGPVRSWTRRANPGKAAPWPRLNISHANNQVGAREDWQAKGNYLLESLDLLQC
jgi:hypothetical protein